MNTLYILSHYNITKLSGISKPPKKVAKSTFFFNQRRVKSGLKLYMLAVLFLKHLLTISNETKIKIEYCHCL